MAHIFETLNNPGQASGRFSLLCSHADTNLPQSTRPLNTLTRTQTGLMTNTAGTTYFYPPECCLDQPYNTYAADVLASLASHVGLGAGRHALRDGGGPPAAVQPRPHRLHGRPAGEGHRDPHRPLARLAISLSRCAVALHLRDLLRRFLEKDPTKRISLDEILVEEAAWPHV